MYTLREEIQSSLSTARKVTNAIETENLPVIYTFMIGSLVTKKRYSGHSSTARLTSNAYNEKSDLVYELSQAANWLNEAQKYLSLGLQNQHSSGNFSFIELQDKVSSIKDDSILDWFPSKTLKTNIVAYLKKLRV